MPTCLRGAAASSLCGLVNVFSRLHACLCLCFGRSEPDVDDGQSRCEYDEQDAAPQEQCEGGTHFTRHQPRVSSIGFPTRPSASHIYCLVICYKHILFPPAKLWPLLPPAGGQAAQTPHTDGNLSFQRRHWLPPPPSKRRLMKSLLRWLFTYLEHEIPPQHRGKETNWCGLRRVRECVQKWETSPELLATEAQGREKVEQHPSNTPPTKAAVKQNMLAVCVSIATTSVCAHKPILFDLYLLIQQSTSIGMPYLMTAL